MTPPPSVQFAALFARSYGANYATCGGESLCAVLNFALCAVARNRLKSLSPPPECSQPPPPLLTEEGEGVGQGTHPPLRKGGEEERKTPTTTTWSAETCSSKVAARARAARGGPAPAGRARAAA